MKYLLSLVLLLISLMSSAQISDLPDFVELTDGDTLWGNVWGVEPNHLRFEAAETGKTAMVALGMVGSFRRNGIVTYPQEELSADVLDVQIAESKIHAAGQYLQNSSTAFYVGTATVIVGVILTVVGSQVTKDPTLSEYLIYSGAAASGIGGLISLTAFIPINKAGLSLKEVKLTK